MPQNALKIPGGYPAGASQSTSHQTLSKRAPYNSYLPVVEEPICVLKIELDGENIEEIKVFENDDPAEIVRKFGDNFNLSQNARQRLLQQIEEQIQMDEDSDY